MNDNKSDVQRILELEDKAVKIPNLSSRFEKPGGEWKLRPIQNEILYRAHKTQGLLGLVGVGEGKTLSSFLLPHVLTPTLTGQALLLIPANMRAQCLKDWKTYSEHFILPSKVELRSYEEISVTPNLLSTINPDYIICDEVHKLKNRDSTRTRRLARYMGARYRSGRPVKFVGLSGTMTSTSIKDYAHIAAWALRERAPVPIEYPVLVKWATVLDRDAKPSQESKASLYPLVRKYGGDERSAYKKRLLSAEGVVISLKSRPDAELHLFERNLGIPKNIVKAINDVNESFQAPNGDELSSALEKVRVLRQLICGFYYFWNWSGEPDKDWLETRSNWNKEVRNFLKTAKEGYDSPALVRNAVIRHLTGKAKERLPSSLLEAYVAWHPHSMKEPPPQGVRWVSDYLIDDVSNWALSQKDPPIIWYSHLAFAARLGRKTGFPVFGQGQIADKALLQVDKPIPAILSARAHSQGKNLQVWGNQIIANPLSEGARLEQLLGRCHRTGQKRETVGATFYSHRVFAAALAMAKLSAKYVEKTTEQEQRLNYGSWHRAKDVVK